MDEAYIKSISVLYVEDDPDIRQTMSLFFNRWGLSYYIAKNGKDGLDLFKEKQPHVVISDIKMPVMNGLDMAEEIKKIDSQAYIILATGVNDQDDLIRSINMGIEKYVLKPIKPKILFDAIVRAATIIFQVREIEAANSFVRFVLDCSPSLMLTTSGMKISYVNNTLLQFLGYESLEKLQIEFDNIQDLLEGIVRSPYPLNDSYVAVEEIINNPEIGHIICLQPRLPELAAKVFSMSCNSFPELGRQIYLFTDVSKIENERKMLEHQASTDCLTGMFNRGKIAAILSEEIARARRYSKIFSVIMFDIDFFKNVNDCHGHKTGDALLMAVTELSSLHVRDQDIISRWGGDEFLIFVPETELIGAINLAEKLREKIAKISLCNIENISCSFGVAQWNEVDSLDTLINRADQAMYVSKNKGRNRVESL